MTVPAAFKPVTELWQRLNPRQRVAIGVAATAVLTLMGALIWFGSQQEYGVLFSDLRTTDAQAIVEKLKAASVPYRLSGGGATVSVPTDRVTEMRLQIAASGILSGNHVGFDIFDRSGFGATDFTQKVNYQRAIEGELARTLEGMDEVEAARVHVTALRDSVFIDKTEPAKASVVLRMRAGRDLSRERTEAVVNLIASGVEGLDPKNISVMDARGRVFAAPDRDGAKAKNGASPLDSNLAIRQKLEMETAARIVELLEPVVGEGRVRANVAADVDFSQIEQTAEKFDPKSATMRSQQTLQESRTGGLRGPGGLVGARANDPQLQPTPTPSPAPANGQPAPSPAASPLPPALGDSRNASTTNWEIDKTVTRTLNNGGRLMKLSASVVVDYRKDAGKAEPRPADELKKMQDLVAAAVGIDTQRGDQVVVQSLPFDLPQDAKPSPLDRYRELILMAIKYGSIVLAALLIIFFAVRPAQKALREAMKPAPALLSATTNADAPLSVGAALGQGSETTAATVPAQLSEGERRAALPGATGESDGEGPRTIAEIESALNAQFAAEADGPTVAEARRASEIRKLLIERSQQSPETVATTLRSWLQEKG